MSLCVRRVPFWLCTLACCAAGLILAELGTRGGVYELLAQESTAPTPTFRSGVDAVALDVVVTDAKGVPVTDLTKDDFELRENGKAQPITTFASVQIPIDPPRGLAKSWSVDSDVASNDQPPGRLYVFAVDEVRGDSALKTRLFLRQFLERFFGPNDVAAVVLIGRGLRTDGQPFTNNSRLLLEAVDKLSGGFPGGAAVGRVEVVNRLDALRKVIEAVATIPAGKKAVMYFAQDMKFDMFTVVDYAARRQLSNEEIDAHAAMTAATRGNVAVYPINPSGLELGSNLEADLDMAALANVTGGFKVTNTNRFMAAFERVRQENSAFYTLGFNSTYTARDGRFVRVDVKVKRPGLTVRHRDGYFAWMGDKRAPNAARDAETPALTALAAPIAAKGLTMRVAAAAYPTMGKEAAVALVAEFDPDTLSLAEKDGLFTGEIEISYTATDLRNRVFPGGRHTMSLSWSEPALEQVRVHGVRLVTTLDLPEGRYQLRVGAGSGGSNGSVLYDLDVPDFQDEPLVLSGVTMTTESTTRGLTLRPPPAMAAGGKPVECGRTTCIAPLSKQAPSAENPLRALSTPASARRTFERDEELTLYAEVAKNGKAQSQAVTYAIALEAEDGRQIDIGTETRPANRERREAFTTRASLQAVPAGRYLMRVEARSSAKGVDPAIRQIPIEVR
jgi:VWFA-related protein